MDAKNDLPNDFVQLARIALSGRPQDIQLVIHRASKRYKSALPEMTESLISLLKEAPTRASPLRKTMDAPLPVDVDSRLQLLKVDYGVIEHDPIFSTNNQIILDQVLDERKNSVVLSKHGLLPTKSLLFNGPPGVGKTLAARWIAFKLNKPLLILDLAAVMSSYLGRTGNNIRFVLDYAKSSGCVLLLDEFDAIAKRRDDNSEIGELKRLVTVLLQEIDDWSSDGLLIAATNHPDLLDPAIWRRFEAVVNFTMPELVQIEKFCNQLLAPFMEDSAVWSKVLSYVFVGKSYSEVERQITLSRKAAAVNNRQLTEEFKTLINSNNLSHDQRIELAHSLTSNDILSQRKAQELTGVARETIRKFKSSN